MKNRLSVFHAVLLKMLMAFFLATMGNVSLYSVNVADSLRNIISKNSSDSSVIRAYLLLNQDFSDRYQYDSALSYLNKAFNYSQKQGDGEYMYKIYEYYSKLFSLSGNYSLAQQYQFKMLNLLDDEMRVTRDTLKVGMRYVDLYNDLGTTFFYNENPSKGLTYFQKSFELARSLQKQFPDQSFQEKMLIFHINIGSAYIGLKDFDKARQSFEEAVEMNRISGNKRYNGVLYNNLGIIFKENGECGKAFPYYENALQIREELKDTAGMAQVLNNLGNCYLVEGLYEKAINSFNQSIEYSRRSRSIKSEMYAAGSLAQAYEDVENYPEALTAHKLFKQLHDSIVNNEAVRKAASLELQYQYDKQIKEKELEKEILVAKKERKALIFLIIAAIFLFSLFILVLLNRNQRIKIKQAKLVKEHLELEQENLQLEKQNLKLDLDLRNKELATHVMYLVNKNEFIASITEKLLTIRPLLLPENKVWVQEIIREMKSNIDNTVWNEFEVRFQQVHEDFYRKLGETYPDLTPNETKLCAFMRLNMTTKDISAITFQSVKSIQVARARLRKKMGITRDDNLVTVLQQL
jgi:tetratricopeptide (TPR) repeat protein/DNA-binding CsgD family transcriptional regulator